MSKRSHVPRHLELALKGLEPKLRKEIERAYRENRDSRGGRFIVTTPPKPGSWKYPYRNHAPSEPWYRRDDFQDKVS